MLNTVLNRIVWWILVLLAVPTTLILVSWNAVPGDSTYKIKIGLEQLLLNIVPSADAKSSLNIKYTERRFTEVEKVLSTSSNNSANPENSTVYASESLNNLNDQVVVSGNSVQEIKNVEEKKIQTEKLIKTLETVSQKIEQKQQQSSVSNSTSTQISTPISTQVPTKIPTATPTIIPTQTVAIITNEPLISTPTLIPTLVPTKTPTSTPVPTVIPTKTVTATSAQSTNTVYSQNISDELEKTNKKIKETIIELKKSQEQEKDNINNKNDNNQNSDASKLDESKNQKNDRLNNH